MFKGCPSGYYGQNCDYQCQGDDPFCKGLLICLPDPYGCSCYSGWYGTNCDQSKRSSSEEERNVYLNIKFVHQIVMVPIVHMNVDVQHVIVLQANVIVKEQNVLKVYTVVVRLNLVVYYLLDPI